MPYGQEGRGAVVYQLIANNGVTKAFKVFKPLFREPRMVIVAENLESYASFQGLQACRREVLTGSRNTTLLADKPELVYTVLMSWIDGSTWQEYLMSDESPDIRKSIKMARSLVTVLMNMEERGLVHCDLAGPNLILEPGGNIELVDLEEMFGSGFSKPELLSSGSSGYAHKTSQYSLWKSQPYRFAGAIMLVEIMCWCIE